MLLIDIGNSRIKLGHYDGQSITELSPLAWRERDLAQVWTTLLGVLPPAPRVVVSNVGGAVVAESLTRWLAERWGVVPQFARVVQDFAGLHTQYQYPEKLGVDRWLAALAGCPAGKSRRPGASTTLKRARSEACASPSTRTACTSPRSRLNVVATAFSTGAKALHALHHGA